MATSQQFLIVDASTLANFLISIQAVSTFIKTQWTTTSDTGQINFATVALPAVGAFAGYEIYKPNDALTPVYLKVEYGRTSPNGMILRLSIGTSTNGAGTLTGSVSALQTSGANTSNHISAGASATWECDFSATGSRLGILLARNVSFSSTNSIPKGFIVERSMNASGVYTSEYLTLISFGQNGASANLTFQSTLVLAGSVFDVNGGANTNPVVIGDLSTSCGANGNIALSPVFPSYGQFGNPMTAAGSARAADVVDGSTYLSSLYGNPVTYMASKSTPNFGPNNASALLMRYE